MSDGITFVLTGLFLAIAMLYATVGHAGASGYLAAMALVGAPPAVMRPTSLTLNVLVATIAAVKFYRAGCFSWRLFWPFACLSVPFAVLGGSLTLPIGLYKQLVGLVLLYSAYRLARKPLPPTAASRPPHRVVALPTGAVIGLLSGLTGVGGGVFLTPLVLFMHWGDPKTTFGVSAPFILVNSIAGLVGLWIQSAPLPGQIPIWAGAVIVGGWIGASYGSRRAGAPAVQRVLAVVLLIAAIRLLAER
jgi:uncharacterized membrane protein YfcA